MSLPNEPQRTHFDRISDGTVAIDSKARSGAGLLESVEVRPPAMTASGSDSCWGHLGL